jgi:hypothetical protein
MESAMILHKLICPALALLVALHAAPASALTLADLAGRWRGEGGYVIGTEPTQRLRCQMRGTPNARGVVLVGRCATAQGGQSFAWALSDLGAGRIQAEDRSPVPDDAPGTLTGQIDALGLRFTTPEGGAFVIAPDPAGLVLRLQGTDAGRPVQAEARLLPDG